MPSHTYTSNGVYQAKLKLTDSFGDSSIVYLKVHVGNTPPNAQMLLPLPSSIFAQHDSIDLSATATDAESPESSLSYKWEVTQVHNNHFHPNFFSHIGKTSAFSYDEHGYPFEVFYAKVDLIVTDPGGLSDTVSRTVAIANLKRLILRLPELQLQMFSFRKAVVLRVFLSFRTAFFPLKDLLIHCSNMIPIHLLEVPRTLDWI